MNTTSASLLERLRQTADPAAWERFVRLYTPLLCHWARRVGSPRQDVEDLVQDVFAVLLRKLPEFRYNPGQRFRGWLRRTSAAWSTATSSRATSGWKRPPTASSCSTLAWHAASGWRNRLSTPIGSCSPTPETAIMPTPGVPPRDWHSGKKRAPAVNGGSFRA
jgi:hypothetical protein